MGTAAVLLLAIAGLFWRHQRPPAAPLTDKDILILADFTNATGDPVFDVTLREALAVQLEQSPFLKILDDRRLRQDLRLTGRSPEDRITNEIARQICLRENEKAMVSGSIAALGNAYAITLEAINCQTGETLAREQVQSENEEHVLAASARQRKECVPGSVNRSIRFGNWIVPTRRSPLSL